MAEKVPESKEGQDVLEHIRYIEESGIRTQDDPRSRKRTVAMEVLVLGFPRSGTFSMKVAFEQLGYSVYHMSSLFQNPPDADMWLQAYNYKHHGKGQPLTRAEWDALLWDKQATMDLPAAAFMPELIEAYPDAKVIVAERDANAWYRSVQNTLVQFQPGLMDFWMLLDHELYGQVIPILAVQNSMGGDIRDEARTKRHYRAVHAEVRGLVSKGPKRLEYQLSDGWGPLCAFLAKEVPEGVPFPHLNESQKWLEATRLMKAFAWKRVTRRVGWIVTWAIGGTMLAGGMFLFLRQRSLQV